MMSAVRRSVAACGTLLLGLAARAPAQQVADDTASRAFAGPRAPIRQALTCAVTRIVDGDTLDCSPVGRIRLIGIDAPERSQVPFGGAAAEALSRTIPRGSTVRVEPDAAARDRYGRVLGYVWIDTAMVNWLMIRQGWAVLLTVPPNVQYADEFVKAQRQARDERRGLWESGAFECLPADRRSGRCD